MATDISRLLTQLNNTGLQNKDTPLYQFLSQLINSLGGINSDVNNINNIINNTTNLTNITQIFQSLSLMGDSASGDDGYTIPGLPGINGKDGVIGRPGDDGLDSDFFFPGPIGPIGLTGPMGPPGSLYSDDNEYTNMPISTGGTVSGTGTSGTLAKWLNSNTLTNSLITEAGNVITINIGADANFRIGGANSTWTFSTSTVASKTNFSLTTDSTGLQVFQFTPGTSTTSTFTINSPTTIAASTLSLSNASANFTVVGTSVTMTIQPGFIGTSSASPNGAFVILVGNATGGKIHDSKGFSWGDVTDPGAGNFRSANATRLVGSVTMDTGVGSYKSVNTAGMGVVPIYAQLSQTGLTGGSNSSPFFVPSGTSVVILWVYIDVTASTIHNFNFICTYSNGVINRNIIISFIPADGVGVITNSITNAAGVLSYTGIPVVFRAISGAGISWTTAGSFTSVTYNLDVALGRIS